MSRWARVTGAHGQFCGGCDALLPPGAWVWLVTIARVRQPLARCVVCAACAGLAPPSDAPPADGAEVADPGAPPPSAAPRPSAPVVRIGQIRAPLGVDWRARAAGSAREPGEEG